MISALVSPSTDTPRPSPTGFVKLFEPNFGDVASAVACTPPRFGDKAGDFAPNLGETELAEVNEGFGDEAEFDLGELTESGRSDVMPSRNEGKAAERLERDQLQWTASLSRRPSEFETMRLCARCLCVM